MSTEKMCDLREKYRPTRFKHLAQGLTDPSIRAITMSVAQRRLPYAFLLRGGYGCAKTTVARLLGLRAACTRQELHPFEPCGTCDNCRSVIQCPHAADLEGYSEYDLQYSSARDLVRGIWNDIPYRKTGGPLTPQRVVTLDEFHRVGVRDQEKFVKLIEDGARGYEVLFVLCVAPDAKVCPAIEQRCLLRPLGPPRVEQSVHHLRVIAKAEGRLLDPANARLLAATAGCVPRVYLGLLQEAIVLSDARTITREVALDVCNLHKPVDGDDQLL